MDNHDIIINDTFHKMARVLKNRPESGIDSGDPLQIRCYRWPHGPLHETIPPLDQHVIIAHFGNMQQVERKTENKIVKNTIREGAITTIPQGSSSRWDIRDIVDVVHLYIPHEIYTEFANQTDIPSTELTLCTAHYDGTASKIISAIADIIPENNKINQLLCEHLILSLIFQLIKDNTKKPSTPPKNPGTLSPYALRTVLEKLDNSPIGDITINKLALDLGISSEHFCRAFKNSTGLTPYGWLKQRVMERAFHELQYTDKLITEIAIESGYSSQNAFTQAFRKITGVTPGQWRVKKNTR
jgi:AraC family transcriptional regulator